MDPLVLKTVADIVEHLEEHFKDILGRILIREVSTEKSKKRTAGSFLLSLQVQQLQPKAAAARKPGGRATRGSAAAPSNSLLSQQQQTQQSSATETAAESTAVTAVAVMKKKRRRKRGNKQKEKDKKRMMEFIERKKRSAEISRASTATEDMEMEAIGTPSPNLSAPEDLPVTGGGGEGSSARGLTRGPPREPPPPTKDPQEEYEEIDEGLRRFLPPQEIDEELLALFSAGDVEWSAKDEEMWRLAMNNLL
jgi:hypothetical protein